jgi:hypothetical protein
VSAFASFGAPLGFPTGSSGPMRAVTCLARTAGHWDFRCSRSAANLSRSSVCTRE